MFRLYFIGGTFGAGKSTLCQSLSESLPAEHHKASELIGHAPMPDDATGKATDQVFSNQERLIMAVSGLKVADEIILLDGHFCLLDEVHAIVRIPVDVFQRLQPSALVLIEAEPLQILNRIQRRDGRRIDIGLIQQLILSEREHGHAVSKKLGVPILIANASTPPREVDSFLRTCS